MTTVVDLSRLVDTSGDVPRVKLPALVSLLGGTVLLGYWHGAINAVQTFGGGFAGSLAGFESWLSSRLIPATFGVVTGPLAAATDANAEFLAGLGVFAQVVAFVEVAVVVVVFVWATTQLLRRVFGVGA